jgi:HK97 family phage major capsid protein
MAKAVELREQAAAKFKEAADLIGTKDVENLDAETETKFGALMEEAKVLDTQYEHAASLEGNGETLRSRLDFYHGKAKGAPVPWQQIAGGANPERKSLGQRFVEAQEYKDLLESGALTSDNARFSSGRVKDRTYEEKAATDVIYSGAGGGGGLIIPQYLPGVLPLPARPLVVRDLFSAGTTTSDTLSYARQISRDSAAAAVAQASSLSTGAKPQSAIGWIRQTSPVETIATWMAATRQQLADAGQTRALIDNQLNLMLKLEEEDQLLNGDGAAPNLRGLLHTVGVQTLNVSGASTSTAQDIARVNLNSVRDAARLVRTGPAFAQPDGVVVNPIDGAEIDEIQDLYGRYLGNGPFNTGPQTLWRLPVVESLAVSQGTALVGAFNQGATVFEREAINVLTSDSHADFFVRNLVAVLGEERLGLAIFFPAAFCEVTLKSWGSITSGGFIS